MTRNPEGTDEESQDARENVVSDDGDGPLWDTTRRQMLSMSAASAAGLGLFGLQAQQSQIATHFRFGGDVSGWQGKAPSSISGETNPTIELVPGNKYKVTWKNLDGLPHNFAILDSDRNVVKKTEIVSEQGATQTLTFTAKKDMATYYCQVHPESMRGDIKIGQSNGGDAPQQPQQQSSGFFKTGPTVATESVAQGMTAPTDMAQPDGSDAFFVTDQTGEVWKVTDQGRQEDPFIDVSDRMVELGSFNGSYSSANQDYDERGLLGIAFHPNYQDNGKFYLHYSAPPNDNTPEGWDHVEVLAEFQANQDGSGAKPDSETKLLEIQHPQYNHDAGPFSFGPDGYLYFPMGDGGGADDDMYGHVEDWYDRNAGGNGQDVTSNLLGNVLRIDVDSQEGDKNYGIPDDNPFAGQDNEGKDEIWAYGLRNPFGIDFDSEGNCYVGMAGQNLWETAWILKNGSNAGWNVREGTYCFSTDSPSSPDAITECPHSEPNESPYDGSDFISPIVEYPHVYNGQPISTTIVGGHRYENSDISGLEGAYVYGDWTADPTRSKPQGRILMAMPPESFSGEVDKQGEASKPLSDGGDASGNATNATGNATGGNATGNQSAASEMSQAGNATGNASAANASNATGNVSTGPGGTEQEGQPNTVTANGATFAQGQAVPRDQLWDMAEVQVEGEFNYFVRQFGQDTNGYIYVLVGKNGVPQGDTGEVLKLVPSEQGGGQSASQPEQAGGNQTGANATGNQSAAGNESMAGNGSAMSENASQPSNATNGTGDNASGNASSQ